MPLFDPGKITSDGWLRIASVEPDAQACGFEAPGLWKQSGTQRVFEAPLRAIVERSGELDFDGDPEEQVVTMLASWAAQTSNGRPLHDWAPPPRDRLDELVPAAALSFRRGSLIEAARLVAGEHTLRVEVTLARLDPTAIPSRREWAGELVAGLSHLRLVRVGLREASIEAAVDLAGAPDPIAQALLPVAVAAIRHCFMFTAGTATLIGDAGCASLLLDGPPSLFHPLHKE